jgi:uncharacterized protein (DUF305 family)
LKFGLKNLTKALSIALALSWTAGSAMARTAQAPQPAPIIQPGAPGEPSREITAEQSLELGRSRYIPADARFMQHMIVHHAQAVDMGALIDTRSNHDGIRLLGRRISLSQTAEISMMQTWLRRRGESTDMPVDHTGHHSSHGAGHSMMVEPAQPSTIPVMPGMLSPAQMVELAAAQGTDFDRLFLTGMIAHHQGALDMVNRLLQQPGAGEDPELSEFLGEINADQSTEISRMNTMLADLG